MLDKGVHSTASPAAKKDIMPGIAPSKKEGERKPISSTSIQKKIQHTREVKQKVVGWP
jgi:hypothetical protein